MVFALTERRIGTAGVNVVSDATGAWPKPARDWLTADISAGNSEAAMELLPTYAATIAAVCCLISRAPARRLPPAKGGCRRFRRVYPNRIRLDGKFAVLIMF
jgi:hypothetical protein